MLCSLCRELYCIDLGAVQVVLQLGALTMAMSSQIFRSPRSLPLDQYWDDSTHVELPFVETNLRAEGADP